MYNLSFQHHHLCTSMTLKGDSDNVYFNVQIYSKLHDKLIIIIKSLKKLVHAVDINLDLKGHSQAIECKSAKNGNHKIKP